MIPFAEHETAIDAAPIDAGDAPEAAPVDVAAEPTDTPTIDAETSWTGPSQDEWEQTQYLLSQIAARANEPAPAAAAPTDPAGPPELDMFDPESVRAYMAWEREQTIAEFKAMVEPLSERAQAEAATEQQNLLKDAARDMEVKKGEFLGDDQAREFAREQMLAGARAAFPQFAARYGQTDRAAELALEHAHAQVKAYESAVAKAAVERNANEIATLSGAPQDPSGGATGLHATPQVKGDEMDFARHYANRV